MDNAVKQENPVRRLEATVLRPMTKTSPAWYAWTAFLVLVVVWAFYAYTVQLRVGLAATGMGNVVNWGLYITNFVFFIGISHAGTLISAILRVAGAEWRRPVTRLAEVITAVALMTGALMPIIDLGRPDRVLNLIRYGRFSSPLVWDIIAITTYLTGSLIYLYLPLIPDIAMARDRLKGTVSDFKWKIYKVLSMGWKGTEQQHRRLNRALSIMMILIIPIAVSVHTVVSWIFSMTLRSGWNSTTFGPYFVVGAIFSGIAGIITVMYIFRKLYHLDEYITDKHFRYLGYLMLVLGVIYIYFTFSEYLTTGYKLAEGDKALLQELLLGHYAPLFWTFAIAGTIFPVLVTALPWTRRNVKWIVLASVLVNIGMWIKRFVIIIPSLSLPLMPYDWGTYYPSWVEISITVGAFAWFALLFTLFAKVFPVISVSEVEEGWEKEAARALIPATGGGMAAASNLTYGEMEGDKNA